MCVVCPCVLTLGLCMGYFKTQVTHPSLRALFSHTWTTTHLSVNRLDCQGHLCCPLLSFHVQTLITLSFSSHFKDWIPLLHLIFILFTMFFSRPSLIFHPVYALICSVFLLLPSPLYVLFLTLMGVSEDHEAMCRAKGLVLSLIRNWGGALHGEYELEHPSWEDVSVTASSTYCQSDSKSNTSGEGGTENT